MNSVPSHKPVGCPHLVLQQEARDGKAELLTPDSSVTTDGVHVVAELSVRNIPADFERLYVRLEVSPSLHVSQVASLLDVLDKRRSICTT